MGLKKQTRYPHGVRDNRSTLDKAASATLTELEIMTYGTFTISGTGQAITLPAASATYKGCLLRIGSIHASSNTNTVVCAEGFGGGTTSSDVITLPALGTIKLFCDGTYWYAMGTADPA